MCKFKGRFRTGFSTVEKMDQDYAGSCFQLLDEMLDKILMLVIIVIIIDILHGVIVCSLESSLNKPSAEQYLLMRSINVPGTWLYSCMQ
jgi:hypothetical protein